MPLSWTGMGKSGALRIYYANIAGFGVVLLGSVYSKRDQADRAPDEVMFLRGQLETVREFFASQEPNDE